MSDPTILTRTEHATGIDNILTGHTNRINDLHYKIDSLNDKHTARLNQLSQRLDNHNSQLADTHSDIVRLRTAYPNAESVSDELNGKLALATIIAIVITVILICVFSCRYQGLTNEIDSLNRQLTTLRAEVERLNSLTPIQEVPHR